jgi:GTPase
LNAEYSGDKKPLFPPTPLNPRDLDRQLESTVFSFSDMQAELNYKQAETALKDLVERLDLTVEEQSGLESAIGDLQAMLDKLAKSVVQIAVFGMVGRGKSSILNALVGEKVFETGPLHGVTQTSQRVKWHPRQDSGVLQVTFKGTDDSQVELIDTPGLDEVDGETRAVLAQDVAKQADLILFAIAGDMTKLEFEALSQLREVGKPILLVINKIDQYPDADRLAIYQKIRDERVRELLSPDEIVMVAASPLVATATRRADGSLSVQRTAVKPQIDELKLKILEVLNREGKSLVALNTMLYAGEVNEQIIERKMEIRDSSANKIIWNAAIAKSIAIALNPFTIADLVGGAAVDVALILGLSKLYGIQMTQTGAVNLLQKIAIAMGGLTAGELLANLGLSSLKSLLGLATPATGGLSLGAYVSVAIAQASVAGVSTYGIGQITKTYLANDASWGPDGPKAVVKNILESLDETSILNRLKAELQARLNIERCL